MRVSMETAIRERRITLKPGEAAFVMRWEGQEKSVLAATTPNRASTTNID